MKTRKNETRYATLDPKKLLGKYMVNRVLKKYTEDFIDSDTGKKESIERSEILFDRGTFIDKDVLSKIQFYISAEEITEEIEVSNQKRIGYYIASEMVYPHISIVDIGGKKCKFLFYAKSIEQSIEMLKDYIELNYEKGFSIKSVKEFTECVILIDKLKEIKLGLDAEYLQSHIEFEEYVERKIEEADEEPKPDERKFYQIEAKIHADGMDTTWPFVIRAVNVDRAMMLINFYLNQREKEHAEKCKSEGKEYAVREFITMVEEAKPISIGCFIPREFSKAYED
ncbi:MAG: RNA polymerase subunit sigma [Bacteroides sp.]|jgi:hypothetical protein|nr:RNA polymerase subunit sigma [Bacteroides sp.]